VEELLFDRGLEVSRESIRTWCINFSGEFAQNLRHQEPRRGSRWHLDEMHVVVGRVTHWLWRAVDDQGAVLDVLLQGHRDTLAASFFRRLLGGYDVPETVCTDKLASYGAAIRALPFLNDIDHQQIISTARCNNLIEQRADVHPGVRSTQDNLTSPHDVRNGAGKRRQQRCSVQEANWASGRSGGRKIFSIFTPESPTCMVLPALPSPPLTADTI